MAGSESTSSARVQHEFSVAKSVFILAVVIGCFAILWPKVFHPMMQTTLMKSASIAEGDSVCCDVIYENKIDFKFFAELCMSVIEREMATDAGIRKHRREKYPPPGMLDRCRKKILEVCDIDISEALTKTKRGNRNTAAPPPAAPVPYQKYRITPTTDVKIDTDENSNEPPKPKLNLTECLEKHFQLKSPSLSWKPPRWLTSTEAHLSTHIRQERPSKVGQSKLHPALREKGIPFHQMADRGRLTSSAGKAPKLSDRAADRQTSTALRPGMSTTQGKPGSGKGVGAMSLLMPIYTIGIVVFFLYTMSKMLLRSPDDRPETKVIEFHSDPEYRSYLVRHKYENGGQPLPYKDFLRKKEEDERKRSAISLLGGVGRKQVFTAIEGIIAEMDEYRERVKAEQNQKTGIEEVSKQFNPPQEELANGQAIHGGISEHIENVSRDKLEDELARITALDVTEEVGVIPTEWSPLPNVNGEVFSIVLEASMPPDTQLLVAESECLTHTISEHIDGWSDVEDQPVVVTGKMTISLMSNKEASVQSTETKTSKDPQVRPSTPQTPEVEERQAPISTGSVKAVDQSSSQERRHIEKLANALVDDVFRNQVPKCLDNSALRNGSSPEVNISDTKNNRCGKKQFNRESVRSQSSSFEYVSACQDVDQHMKAPIFEEDIVGMDGDGQGEMQDNVREFNSLECSSRVSASDNSIGCNGQQNVEGTIGQNEDGGDESEEVDSRDKTPELKEIRRFD